MAKVFESCANASRIPVPDLKTEDSLVVVWLAMAIFDTYNATCKIT